MSTTMPAPAARRSSWIPWVFVGLMLLVVVVNGVLVYASVSTFTGVTVGRSYDRGRAYNQVLAEAARQDRLGWTATVTLAADGLAVRAEDQAGQPVAGELAGLLRRPLDGQEVPLEFIAVGPGEWVAVPAGLRPGQWEARLRLQGPDGAALDIRQRLVAP
jgi:nitrogen fixation protein FixH